MSVQLGTVAPIGFRDFPPAEWLACCRALGCTTVQAYRSQTARVSVEQMKDALAAGGMPCDSLHGMFGEQFDPSSPDEQARRFAVNTYQIEGELSIHLGGPLVVVHCSSIRRDSVSESEHLLRLKQLKKSIQELGAIGRQIGVTYAFENLPAYHPIGGVKEVAAILKEAAAPNTGLCYDTGHANMLGNPAELLGQTDGTVIYIHLSDNMGKADEHLMPMHGNIDCDALAREIHRQGYNGTVMLEVFYGIDRMKQLVNEGFADRLARFIRLANGKTE